MAGAHVAWWLMVAKRLNFVAMVLKGFHCHLNANAYLFHVYVHVCVCVYIINSYKNLTDCDGWLSVREDIAQRVRGLRCTLTITLNGYL